MYRTNDGGDTWSVVFSPAQSVCFGDANVAWVAGGGEVKRTVDGGATWTTVANNVNTFTTPVTGARTFFRLRQ